MNTFFRLMFVAARRAIIVCGGTAVTGLWLYKTVVQANEPSRSDAVAADVTVVEYFDYNCAYCKQLGPTLRSLHAQDPKITVIYKEWPILGDVSVYAARAALSAKWQGKYLIAHDALLDAPRLSNNEMVDAVLTRAGIDIDKLKQDESSHATELNSRLAHDNTEARALGIRGTPGVLINQRLATGIVDPGALRRLIAEARASR